VIEDKNTVGLTYCNGVEFLHEHETQLEAVQEFTNLLRFLVNPDDDEAPVHLRQVVVTIFNKDGKVQRMDSGVFTCAHSTEPVPA
jgi:hypothetical protein